MRSVVIGVAGGSGSGKTTVVRRLVAALGEHATAVLEHDRYYLDVGVSPAAVRAALNFDHPEALETDLLIAHVQTLRVGLPVAVPVYDFTRHVRVAASHTIPPRPVILVEGILVMAHPGLRALMDLKLFVETDEETRFARRLERDVTERGRTEASVRAQYDATVRPMHMEFVEPTKSYADLVITEGGHNDAGIEHALAMIRQRLTTG